MNRPAHQGLPSFAPAPAPRWRGIAIAAAAVVLCATAGWGAWSLHEGGGPAGMIWVPGDDRVAGFWMDKMHITHEHFAAFVKATGYVTSSKYPPGPLSYEDAQAYARWVGKRLPTRAEQEFATRGGLDREGGQVPYAGFRLVMDQAKWEKRD